MKFRRILFTVFLFCGEVFSQNISDFTQVEHYSSGIFENESYRNQNLQYVTAESTKVYSNDWELVAIEKKNKIMENCSLTITLDHYVMIGKDNHWMNADDLYIRGSSFLPEEIVYDQIHPEYEWIPVWYNEVIKCQGADFKKAVYKYAPFLEGKWLPDSECWWYEDVTFSYPCVFRFQNTYLCLTTDGWGVQKFLIEKIIERNESYSIHCKSLGFYYDEYKDNLCYFENFPRVNHGETFVLRLEQNGGHLFLYNGETNKLIEELMPASRAWIKKLQEYFNTGINTFTPEDVSLLSRKTDAPTTEYVEPSESENANKEELANSPATEHTEPIENAAFPETAETPNGEADAPKAPALPIVPVAAGVAVLAILLVAILLAAKKRKGGMKQK